MIPKSIHYCWFGRNPKPKLAKKCIKSWKKYCPDYEIIEWNEDNFDISSAPLYVRQAYEAKKWAFVSDYVRLHAMVKYGGVYMDTDVELLKPIDNFLHHHAFSGFEDDIHVPTGIMGCEKNYTLFRKFLQHYDNECFLLPSGEYNMLTNVFIITSTLQKSGLIPNNSYQEIDGFALYPKDYFCPYENNEGRLKITHNTVAIHWFTGSWLPSDALKRRNKNREMVRRADLIHNITHLPNRLVRHFLGAKQYDKLKSIIKLVK